MLRTGRGFFLAVAVILATGLPAIVLADEATDRARRHNAAGRALFNVGQYEQAALEYERAYQAKPVPVLLYNSGQCYKRLDGIEHKKKALSHFETYLANDPDAANRQQVQEEIAGLKQQIEKLHQAQVNSEREKARFDEILALVAEAESDKPKVTPFYKTWWFWTVVGVVVAGATTATVVALQPDDVENVTGGIPPGEIQFD